MLLSAAIIWGSSFIVMKNAVDFLTPAILLSIRFILASLFLSILFYKQVKSTQKKHIIGGLITGVCLFFAYYIQTWGLSFTTPGKNAFLTAVYCAIVPFLLWIIYKKKPDSYNIISALLCIIGIGFISLDSQLSVNIGDILTLIGGFLYALHIIFTKEFGKLMDGGAFTVFQFIGATCLSIIVAIISEDLSIISYIKPSIYLQLIYLAFFATGIAMLFQTLGQSYVSECQASLLLSLESVFGVLFSIIFYNEVSNLKVFIGFVLVFLAIIISETKLSFLKKEELK